MFILTLEACACKHKVAGSDLSLEAVKKGGEGESEGLGWGELFWLSVLQARPGDSFGGERPVPSHHLAAEGLNQGHEGLNQSHDGGRVMGVGRERSLVSTLFFLFCDGWYLGAVECGCRPVI